VTGLGPVGLGAVANARFRNARVIGVEPMPWRRERAMQMGAEAVFAPDEPDLVDKIRAIAVGGGVSCALECSGRLFVTAAVHRRGPPARARSVCGRGRRRPGHTGEPDLLRKGLTIVRLVALQHGRLLEGDAGNQQSPLIDLLVSHVMPMSQIQAGFELAGQRAER